MVGEGRVAGRVLGAIAALASLAVLAHAKPGDVVSNTAFVSHDGRAPVPAGPAVFTIETRRTPSAVTFLRYAPQADACSPMMAHGSDVLGAPSPSLRAAAPASAPAPAIGLGGARLDTSAPLCLAPADTYLAGELVFVSVEDQGENADPHAIETLTVTVRTEAGDEVSLRLYETGPDTSVFLAYVPSGAGAPDRTDGVLSLGGAGQLTATYQDRFDGAEVSVDVAAVTAGGRVFDSVTGEVLSGVRVTIVDAATGEPARVTGPDGMTPWPSTVISGASVAYDGADLQMGPGGFLFPALPPGSYRLRVEPPDGYAGPSAVTAADVAALGGGFVMSEGSWMHAFAAAGLLTGFDVPLDPAGEVTLRKTTTARAVRHGDLVPYEVTMTAAAPMNVVLHDAFPRGFAYQPGSARLGGVKAEPVLSPSGDAFSLALRLPAGDPVTLTYLLRVTPGAARGEAVNAASVARGPETVSNAARAAVTVEEDRLSSRVTILGRVAADACGPDGPWPDDVTDGEPVAGVRLLMETGAYAVTKADGLFSFEDVTARPHVVQVDPASLPRGYEIVPCERDSRGAATGHARFIDAAPGTIARADFFLRRTAAAEGVAVPEAVAEPEETDPLGAFDRAWLDAAPRETRFAWPAEGAVPAIRSVDLVLVHPHGAEVDLTLNGRPVAYLNLAERVVSTDRASAATTWRGVDIEPGENRVQAVIRDAVTGVETARLSRSVWFVTDAVRAEVDADASRLVADGRSEPVVALRLTDAGGRPLHAGRTVRVAVDPPYVQAREARLERAMPIGTPDDLPEAAVGADGLLRVALAPTTRSGRVTLRVPTRLGERVVTAQLTPELRDFVVVGLADGTVAEGGVDVRSALDAPSSDERLAFYAQGTVRGGWLVTAAVDTDKDQDRDELLREVAPRQRYALTGDEAEQGYDAQSRLPVYLRAERAGTQLLLGDYDTGMTAGELARYDRRLTGVRATHDGARGTLTAFASDTRQDFRRDEISADGTSGPYALQAAPLVVDSEVLRVETRDRYRPDVVLAVRTLERWADYDIDFATGRIVLNAPLPAFEAGGDNVLVATYETDGLGERALAAGARAELRTLDGAALGITALFEEGREGEADAELLAADAVIQVTDHATLRAEAGVTGRGNDQAMAVLIEAEHASDRIEATASYAQAEDGYGLGQLTSARTGLRRYGMAAEVRLHEGVDEATGRRAATSLDVEAYREESLVSDARRDLAEIALRQDGARLGAALGLRGVSERVGGEERRAALLTMQLRRAFPDWGASVSLTRDQSLTGDAPSLFAERTAVAIEKRLTEWVRAEARHQILHGERGQSATTTVGLKATPFGGTVLTASTDLLTQDDARRLGATFGADQRVALTETVTASLTVTRRVDLDGDGEVEPLNASLGDAPVSPLEGAAEFTSVAAGLAYRTEATVGSVRAELRDDARTRRTTQVVGAAREVSETFSFGVAARFEQTGEAEGADTSRATARLGAAYRPRGEGVAILQSLELDAQEADGGPAHRTLTNHLALSAEPTERTELSLAHAVRYAETEAGDVAASALTQLLAGEVRYDLTPRVDVGLRVAVLHDHEGGGTAYSYGPSLGVSPADGAWITVGYNLSGFDGGGLEAAEHAEEGAYIRLRLRFDQDRAKGLLNHLAPRSRAGGKGR